MPPYEEHPEVNEALQSVCEAAYRQGKGLVLVVYAKQISDNELQLELAMNKSIPDGAHYQILCDVQEVIGLRIKEFTQ